MNHIYKKFALAIIMAAIMPMQAHGYAASFNAALACATAWVKKYAGPALIGMSAISTFACAADYAANKAELDLLNKMMADLEKQRQEKKLSPCEQKYKPLMPVVLWQDLKKEIQDYDAALQGNKNNASDAQVIACYENIVAFDEFNRLQVEALALENKKQRLIEDPRCDILICYDDTGRSCVKQKLEDHLPKYAAIRTKYLGEAISQSNAGEFLEAPLDRNLLDAAQSIVRELARECAACRTHIQTAPVYKKNSLDKIVYAYLDQLSDHAKAFQENIKKLVESNKKLIQFRSNNNNNNFKDVAVAYHELRKYVAQMIAKRSEQQRTCFRHTWQTSAVFLGAVAAAAYFKAWH